MPSEFIIPFTVGDVKTNLKYVGGDSMEVEDFCGVLEAMDSLIQAADKAVNGPRRPRIPVRVSSVKVGSG